jgi:acetoin utilization protein AcuB
MIVSMWMTRDVVTAGPETLAIEAASLMARKHIRRLLVAEKGGDKLRLLGIVSARDILHAFPPEVNPFAVETPDARHGRVTVGEIMRHDVQTVLPDTPIEAAAELMLKWKIGALPVLRDGHLAGIITESDIFRAFVGMFATEEPGARITFDVSQGEDVFGLILSAARRGGVRVTSLMRSQQDSRSECVVRVEGEAVDDLLDELWNSGHPVLNVVRFPPAEPGR